MKKVLSSRISWLFVLTLLLCSFPASLRPDPMPAVTGLTHKLQRALVGLPGYTIFDYVTFRIADDRVVLLGNVLHPEVKQEAEQAIRSIPGVNALDNYIDVLPRSEQDDAIRQKVYERLYGNPQFTWYAVQLVPPVHIIVKNGHVTLEGLVNNPSDRFMAENAACEAAGASAVEDHLLAMSGDIGELSSLGLRMEQ
ncbi:MAG TPA: BON domain-containing protein [Bryobacteraceae bacterium]|nr:BON domain-containing protein [Bryobacteraceae bacterium]